jgi:hypothetical protein
MEISQSPPSRLKERETRDSGPERIWHSLPHMFTGSSWLDDMRAKVWVLYCSSGPERERPGITELQIDCVVLSRVLCIPARQGRDDYGRCLGPHRQADPGFPPRMGKLHRKELSFEEPEDDEALVEPLFASWEANIAHAISRQPIDVCDQRDES